MEYGSNSDQVEAYLQQVARLDADGWAAMAQVLKDSPGLLEEAVKGIDTARSRAAKNGLLSQVDAAARETHQAMDTTLDASPGLRRVLDRARAHISQDDHAHSVALRGPAIASLRTAATSGASLLVLRPLLTDDEFGQAWPMRVIDPRSLPHHLYAPPMRAVG